MHGKVTHSQHTPSSTLPRSYATTQWRMRTKMPQSGTSGTSGSQFRYIDSEPNAQWWISRSVIRSASKFPWQFLYFCIINCNNYTIKIKVKLSLCSLNYAPRQEDVRGSGCVAYIILDLGSRRRWMVSLTRRSIYPREIRPCYLLNSNLDGPQKWFRLCEVEKDSCPYRQSRTGRPACRCAYWAIPALKL
jgi:hypothetical protein